MFDIWLNIFCFVEDKYIPLLRLVDKYFYNIIEDSPELKHKLLRTLDDPFESQFRKPNNHINQNYVLYFFHLPTFRKGENFFKILRFLPDDPELTKFSILIVDILYYDYIKSNQDRFDRIGVQLLRYNKLQLFQSLVDCGNEIQKSHKSHKSHIFILPIMKSGHLLYLKNHLDVVHQLNWEYHFNVYLCKTSHQLQQALDIFQQWFQFHHNHSDYYYSIFFKFHFKNENQTIFSLLLNAKSSKDFREMIDILPWKYLFTVMPEVNNENDLYRELSRNAFLFKYHGIEYLICHNKLNYSALQLPYTDFHISQFFRKSEMLEKFITDLLKEEQNLIDQWKTAIEGIVTRNCLVREMNRINHYFEKNGSQTINTDLKDFFKGKHTIYRYKTIKSIQDQLDSSTFDLVGQDFSKPFIIAQSLRKNDISLMNLFFPSNSIYRFYCGNFESIIERVKPFSILNKRCLSFLFNKIGEPCEDWESIVKIAMKRRLFSLLDWIFDNDFYDFKQIKQIQSISFTAWKNWKISHNDC